METQTQQITKDMTMGEIIEKFPFASEVMLSYGLHCVGCHVNPYESLENGALGHGMSDEEISSMLQELNDLVKSHSSKSEEGTNIKDAKITITEFAAKKIIELMKGQHKEGQGLRVEVARGGCAGYTYNMDFESKPAPDDMVFEEHGLRIFVAPKSMEFLNGTQIDYVESLQGAGFKLNNPNVKSSCGCGKSVH